MAAVVRDGVLSRLPIIVILGATGTGKSKLALQVAKHFDGEIISADAMQVYKGLDIVTNKVTADEQKEVPHHMIDYLNPGDPINVVDFRDKTLPIINNLLDRNKLPVVAGGTYYYVESILYKVLMDSARGVEAVKSVKRRAECLKGGLGNLSYLLQEVPDGVTHDPVEALTPEDKARLHHMLADVDPERAAELHPNNVRKVIRSLQVFDTTGRQHSEQIREQRAAGGNHLGGPLRYPNSLILWVTCDKEVLNQRLDARVDAMISQGLIKELQQFHDHHNRQRLREQPSGVKTAAYTLGIFQSIGFKEFHDYLMLSDKDKKSPAGKKLFDKGVEQMKLSTRQYATRQLKWIRRRFLGREASQVPPVYALNGTNLTEWNSQVRDKAFSVVQSALDGTPCPIQREPINTNSTPDQTVMKCLDCDRFFLGKDQYQDHLKSMKHKRRLIKIAKDQNQNEHNGHKAKKMKRNSTLEGCQEQSEVSS